MSAPTTSTQSTASTPWLETVTCSVIELFFDNEMVVAFSFCHLQFLNGTKARARVENGDDSCEYVIRE